MPIPLNDITAAVLHDEDGEPIDSVLDGATRRLAVDAVVAAGGILDQDTDDDSIASGQTLLLSIVENYQFDGTNWRRDQARAANTAIDQDLMYKLTRAALSGVDSSAGAGSEVVAVEARNADADGDFAESLNGILVNSRPSLNDEITGDFVALDGMQDGIAASYVMQPRESGFPATRQGRRFTATHQTPGTRVAGQTSFDATTPTFLLRQNGASVRVVLRSIILSDHSGEGDTTDVVVVIDTADRFSSGGTSVTPQNVNEESATASAITAFLTNPTATAAGAGTRVIFSGCYESNGPPITYEIDFQDGVLIGTTGALLVYVFSSDDAPSLTFTFEWEEIP